jgi:NAD(P)-dependent dehydrogenase (short-subunit alcohol dehydrogenase family)
VADDLAGRTILITGATTGIGLATAHALAARGATLVLACRSQAGAAAAIDDIRRRTGNQHLSSLPLDLGDLASVRDCAAAFAAEDRPLHVLINNAGVAGGRGTTPSGFELAFGTNHVGPFLLTALLLDRLTAAAPARIVNVASDAHFSAHGIDFDAVRRPTRSRTGMAEYGVSKLANVLHAQELGRRLDGTGVTTYALHPGVIASDIWRRVPWPVRPIMKLRMSSTEEGARTPVYCATAPELAGETGGYYVAGRRKEPSAAATRELAAALWEHSVAWTSDAQAAASA